LYVGGLIFAGLIGLIFGEGVFGRSSLGGFGLPIFGIFGILGIT